MRGTGCAETQAVSKAGMLAVEVCSFEALPSGALALLDEADSVFAGRAWWEAVLAHAMPAGAVASFVAIGRSERIVALVPMLREALFDRTGKRSGERLGSLTSPYTCEFAPLFAGGLSSADRVAAMAAFGRFCRPAGVVRLDALAVEWTGLDDLAAGAGLAGLVVLRFDHFGNWYDDVGGLDWTGYLAGRTGALRETIRRRLRRADRLAEARFELLTQPAEMDRAAAAFESVYQRSWKDAEPYPTFNVALMRGMAAQGWLRLGVWSISGEPVAVQLWVLKDGTAIVLKLAHDEAYKAHSPGTVLTALMLRHLLDEEHVVRIDFGRGDDAYKQGWATRRRQRIGVVLVNPWCGSGMSALMRHAAGRVRAGWSRLAWFSKTGFGTKDER